MFRFARKILPISTPLAILGLANFTSTQQIFSQGAFSPQEFRQFPLVDVLPLNHNANIFRFSLPAQNSTMGMKVASCILVEGVGRDGKVLSRPYTPISSEKDQGYFDLLIKNYPDGNVSTFVHSLKIGDNLKVKGPFPKLQYTPNMFKKIGMVAGGTGITPMLQVITEILDNPADITEISLVFGNNTEQDVLLKDYLDELQGQYSNFKVYYLVSNPSSDWKGGVGRVDRQVLQQKIPAPGPETMIFVCGPPPMMEAISGDKAKDKSQGELTGLLKELGYTKEQVFKF
jgi:cytochrome-b5 reductase